MKCVHHMGVAAKLRQVMWCVFQSACDTEFTVGKEFMVGRVHSTIDKERAELTTQSACVT